MEEKRKIVEGLFELPEGLSEAGYLVGSRCKKCQTISYPKRVICPNCLEDREIEVTRLSQVGRLYSYSINRMAPEGFTAPYITGRVDLPEHVRIFSVITGCEPDEDALQIGMEMALVFEPLRQDAAGNDLYSYKFKPLKNG
ncbi:MAG: Zn-ribbon domain-containing OB-fold protein [bacterium]